ncbi:ribosomal-processing cysteine protease Prp [Ureaplasma sp. ES3154-GEN]|uniref:ribosomal-processing cysteine protease Prp n=1 Tax=Ureaplasma sp. ES3154-GEN TaxID=2984844 RepID=UPI0021E82DDE|nr:ribosomal-processing cysteine protease Prp [Ureaplasma sp. ES3154-GEN]MCV3743854.1 ribosomal-processing cysteine protease Prp [Ureaplasma sp. ES3154-GEN]
MISINKYPNGLIIQGHAMSAPYGQDLVCAGVSAVSLSALNWFDKKTISVQIDDGDYQLIIIKKSKHNSLLLNLLFIQLQGIAQSYNQYIEINEFTYELKKE